MNAIDEEIAALERELECYSTEEEEEEEGGGKDEEIFVSPLLLSEENIIHPLPHTMLPMPGCAKSLKVKRNRLDEENSNKPSKKIRDFNNRSVVGQSNDLSVVIDEIIKNFHPNPVKGGKFWCVVCSCQLTSVDEFESHVQTELHIAVQEKYRKLSYCKMCKKQFHSPTQLAEHNRGKSHAETLTYLKSKQAPNFNRSMTSRPSNSFWNS